jgi:hypothetical protein
MRQRSGKKWRRLAREPAEGLDLSWFDLGQHSDKSKRIRKATGSENGLTGPKTFTMLVVCPKINLSWTAMISDQ